MLIQSPGRLTAHKAYRLIRSKEAEVRKFLDAIREAA